MGIFLSILKIIGIVLLCILGFILLILLLVLFVPFTYKVKGSYHEDISADARVGWLFGIAGVQVAFADKALNLYLRILGFIRIPLGKKKEKAEEPPEKLPGESPPEKAEAAKEAKAKAPEKTEEKKPEPEASKEPEPAKKTEAVKEPEPAKESEAVKEPEAAKEAEPAKEPEAEEKEKEDTAEDGKTAEERSLEEKITDWIEGKLDLLRKKKEELDKKLEDLKDKKDFIFYERTQNAIRHVLSMVLKMLKHILPSNLSGEVELGLKSPADTGQVIAYAAMLMPLHKNKIKIIPDFENEHIDADVKLKNWIFLIVILVRIILNKDVLYVLKNYKKHFS